MFCVFFNVKKGVFYSRSKHLDLHPGSDKQSVKKKNHSTISDRNQLHKNVLVLHVPEVHQALGSRFPLQLFHALSKRKELQNFLF